LGKNAAYVRVSISDGKLELVDMKDMRTFANQFGPASLDRPGAGESAAVCARH
jgi:hypothetical protein